MKLQLVASTAVAALLTGCGGSDGGGGATTVATPTTSVTSLAASTVVLSAADATRIAYDSTADELIVEGIPFDDDVFSARYTRTAALDRPGYQAYSSTNGFDTYVAFYGTSTSGATAVAVTATNEFADNGYRGAMYQRNTSVTLPSTTQRAFYNGTYVGLRTDGGGNPTMDTITGTVRMEADFSDDVVRGGISGRNAVVNESGTAVGNNLILGDASINRTTGAFNGAVSEVIGGNDATGTYEGLFGDTDASEIAGVLVINAGDLTETGVFIAEQ